MSIKILKCWLTRHHWLLQAKIPVARKVGLFKYRYDCQYCGKIMFEQVRHL